MRPTTPTGTSSSPLTWRASSTVGSSYTCAQETVPRTCYQLATAKHHCQAMLVVASSSTGLLCLQWLRHLAHCHAAVQSCALQQLRRMRQVQAQPTQTQWSAAAHLLLNAVQVSHNLQPAERGIGRDDLLSEGRREASTGE